MLPEVYKTRHLQSKQSSYKAAKPFPHAVIDNFLPETIASEIEKGFPGVSNFLWQRQTDIINKKQNTEKLACNELSIMPKVIQDTLNYFNSTEFLSFLTDLTGIENLVADPDLLGGGMHLIRPGGFLKVHADFNLHPVKRLDRRLNMLIYFNRDWMEEYKGNLELWNKDMTKCVSSITPIFNRCVVFNTTSDSFHGHPHKLACPEEMSRKSLALYYYTDGRPKSEKNESHSTLYQEPKSAISVFLKKINQVCTAKKPHLIKSLNFPSGTITGNSQEDWRVAKQIDNAQTKDQKAWINCQNQIYNNLSVPKGAAAIEVELTLYADTHDSTVLMDIVYYDDGHKEIERQTMQIIGRPNQKVAFEVKQVVPTKANHLMLIVRPWRENDGQICLDSATIHWMR